MTPGTDEFSVALIESAEDQEAVVALLERVRRDELNRGSGPVLDSDVFDGHRTEFDLLGCREASTGAIVGCIRLTPAIALAGVESARHEYRLDALEAGDVLDLAVVLTRLAISPEHRDGLVGLEMYRGIYRYSILEGYELSILSCEPNLLPLYESLGGRPYGPVHRGIAGGLRLPVVFLPYDDEHYFAVSSPIAGMPTLLGVEHKTKGVEWFHGLDDGAPPHSSGIRPYVAMQEGPDWLLTRNLSPSGVSELLHHCLVVELSEGDEFIAEADGSSAIGFVIDGLVEVRTGERVVAWRGVGEVFGEMAPILGERRSATLVAATEDTRVGILSQRALDRVSDPADRETLWRNLAWILARKLEQATGPPDAAIG